MSEATNQTSGNFTSGNPDNREMFNDSDAKVESYGAGPGSGAYDPTSTGLGGYGGSNNNGQNDNAGGFAAGGANPDDAGFGGNQSSTGGSDVYQSGGLSDQLDAEHDAGKDRGQIGGETFSGKSSVGGGGGNVQSTAEGFINSIKGKN